MNVHHKKDKTQTYNKAWIFQQETGEEVQKLPDLVTSALLSHMPKYLGRKQH